MKRLFTFILCSFFTINIMGVQLKAPRVVINGNLSKYKYAYVMPTGSLTSNSGMYGSAYTDTYGNSYWMYGGPTTSINPSETIRGYLMKMGYTILSQIDAQSINKTMIVSYGYTGRRALSFSAYASCIMIQILDAKTHDIVATYETEGCGSNEADDILQAIYTAMLMHQYGLSPKIHTEILKVSKNSVRLYLKNKTPYWVEKITLRITYYLDGNIVHKQDVTLDAEKNPSEDMEKQIKRDNAVRSKKYEVGIEVLSYE